MDDINSSPNNWSCHALIIFTWKYDLTEEKVKNIIESMKAKGKIVEKES